MKKEYPRVPFPLIVKACDGDTEAIEQNRYAIVL